MTEAETGGLGVYSFPRQHFKLKCTPSKSRWATVQLKWTVKVEGRRKFPKKIAVTFLENVLFICSKSAAQCGLCNFEKSLFCYAVKAASGLSLDA